MRIRFRAINGFTKNIVSLYCRIIFNSEALNIDRSARRKRIYNYLIGNTDLVK